MTNPVDLPQKLANANKFLGDGDYASALAAYKKLAGKWPRSERAWMGWGRAARSLGRMEEADRAWERAKELNPHSPELLLEFGQLYRSLNLLEKARTSFEEAAAAAPKEVNPRICIALLDEKQHRFTEARLAVEQCFAIDPADEQARYVSALLCYREGKLEQAERELRDLIASGPKLAYVLYSARFELAQVLDRTGRFDEAMQCLAEAKSMALGRANLKAYHLRYDTRAERNRRDASAQPKNFLHAWAKTFPETKRNQIPRFAFLGGHPRSGTTLLEQVLGSHPEIAAVDEPLYVNHIAKAAVAELSFGNPAVRLNLARLRYLGILLHTLGSKAEGKFLLEKNPSPTETLPNLLRLFPELRVIIALRDPRDVVLSCYFQNFQITNVTANFLSLDRAAVHYANLMDVWLAVRQWVGLAWVESRYEDIVGNLEKEGRRVTEFLGLQWQESQTLFFAGAGKAQVQSPTYHDVRQPIYSRSVARWRNYQKYLEPILPALEPYCRAFGYS